MMPRIGALVQRRAEHVHRLSLVRPVLEGLDELVGRAPHDDRVDAGDEFREAEVAARAVVGCATGVASAGEEREVAVESGDEPVDAHAQEDRSAEGHDCTLPDGSDFSAACRDGCSAPTCTAASPGSARSSWSARTMTRPAPAAGQQAPLAMPRPASAPVRPRRVRSSVAMRAASGWWSHEARALLHQEEAEHELPQVPTWPVPRSAVGPRARPTWRPGSRPAGRTRAAGGCWSPRTPS